MSIEAHLTISLPSRAAPDLEAWLPPQGFRATSIELSRGLWPVQTMITGPLPEEATVALRRARSLRDELATLGIEVRRIKLELHRVYEGKGLRWEHGEDPGFMTARDLEWESFSTEYPALAAGDKDHLVERLTGALKLVL